jgi:hypothetical protein
LDTTYSSLADEIKEKKDLTPEIEKEIKWLISEILKEWSYN